MPSFKHLSSAIDALARAQQIECLLDLAKQPDPTLDLLGSSPAEGTVYVYDNGFELGVGAELACLMECATTSGLEMTEPELAQDDDGDYPAQWVVRMHSQGVEAGVLCHGPTLEEALHKRLIALRDLSGTSVRALQAWVEDRAAIRALGWDDGHALPVATKPTPKPRKPPFVTVKQMQLEPLPLAPALASLHNRESFKLRRKGMDALLARPHGMHTPGGGMSGMTMQVIEDEGHLYANQHDLLAAVRLGLDVTAVRPWPNELAHRFLIARETARAMRKRGFLELRDFDPIAVYTIDRPKTDEIRQSVDDSGLETRMAWQRDMQPEEIRALKPEWPPHVGSVHSVVMVLDHARLAMEHEPEWELSNIRKRTVIGFAEQLWVAVEESTTQKKPKAIG